MKQQRAITVVVRTDKPDVARRRRHTAEQSVRVQGTRTRRETPGGAVPMQQQRHPACRRLMVPERPDIRCRDGCDPIQLIRVVRAVLYVGAGHHGPTASIPMLDQR